MLRIQVGMRTQTRPEVAIQSMELMCGGTYFLDSIRLAPDLLECHRFSMDWHWICYELTPR